MNLSTRLATLTDLPAYTDFLQLTYTHTYTADELGLTKECWSKEVFASPRIQAYLRDNLTITEQQQTWLVFDGTKLIASLSLNNSAHEVDLWGFYVDSEYQGRGIGSQLWQRARQFAGAQEIMIDTYSHNTKAIEIYQHWGFKIDTTKAPLSFHWPEWPEGLQAKCIYLRYTPQASS